MPRDLPVANGRLLVNFDHCYNLTDVYYPHIGGENHTNGEPCRFGIWADGRFAWISSDEWQRDMRYEPDTLVTHVIATSPALGLRLTCSDIVDFDADIYVKRIDLQNLQPGKRQVRLYFHFDCNMGGTSIGNTVFYEPAEIDRALVMYRESYYLAMGAFAAGAWGFTSFATGNKGLPGLEGTWRDAEDGSLGRSPIAQGSVDCVGQVEVELETNATVYFFFAAGENYDVVRGLHAFLKDRGPESFLARTRNYWKAWVGKHDPVMAGLPPAICGLYRRSLLVLRTQIDNNGAILAANDTDILRFGRDTYSYVWPRDGALVADALVRAGYSELTRRFFLFLKNLPARGGYLLHKYNPDGSLGSSWHPWVDSRGHRQLPIQEDESALPILSLWHFFDRFREVEAVHDLYKPLVKEMADFLVHYRDSATHLPRPSYDLWEERHGVLSYTVGAVWAGLDSAARFTEAFGEADLSAHYFQIAEEVKTAALSHLYDEELGRFVRMIYKDENDEWQKDRTLDASLAGLFLFGMLPADDDRVVRTMQAVEDRLWCHTGVGGVARYEDDYYHQVSHDLGSVPGNPWFICTLWLARWQIQKARTMAQLARPLELMQWTVDHALPSGVLAEQVHPYDGSPLSVSPLTWSHAEFVATVLDYVEQWQRIHLSELQEAGMVPLIMHRSGVDGLVMKPDPSITGPFPGDDSLVAKPF